MKYKHKKQIMKNKNIINIIKNKNIEINKIK